MWGTGKEVVRASPVCVPPVVSHSPRRGSRLLGFNPWYAKRAGEVGRTPGPAHSAWIVRRGRSDRLWPAACRIFEVKKTPEPAGQQATIFLSRLKLSAATFPQHIFPASSSETL